MSTRSLRLESSPTAPLSSSSSSISAMARCAALPPKVRAATVARRPIPNRNGLTLVVDPEPMSCNAETAAPVETYAIVPGSIPSHDATVNCGNGTDVSPYR